VTAPAIPGPPARPPDPRIDPRPLTPRPGAGDARPEPDIAARRPGLWAAVNWRWFLLVWLFALVVLAANAPGRMIFDTKLGVDINAAEFIERLWPLWNPREWFGTLQNQYIGYAIPMAPFFLLGQALRLPVWVIERLWLSLLIAVGFSGITKLATSLRIGSNASRLLAGVVFVLWPTFTIVIGSTSAAALPGLLVPWAVLPLVTALQGRGSVLSGCARSGVAIALMGGVNAVSTICALMAPGLYLLTHTRGRQRVKVCLLWATAVAAATAWWSVPLLLQGRYSFNFLPFVEQANTTTKTMSAAAFLRGTGNWTAYLDLGTPWLTAGWEVVANPVAITASAVAAAVGLAGLARRDMPQQLWLRLCVGLAAVIALAGYGGALGGPLHGLVQAELNGTLAPFRNVSKLEPVAALALVLGIAHLLAGASSRALPAAPGSRRMAAGVVAAPAIALCLAGLALPYLTGQILQPGSFTSVPKYWYQVAAFLAARSPEQTALVVPGDSHGIYLWGDPIDEPLEPLATSPWVERSLVPYGGAGSQVFLDTAETAMESGQRVPGLAAYLARAGIRYVVVRNDLSPDQLGYTPPQTVAQTLALSGFSRVASFGPMITGDQTSPGASRQVQAYLPRYPAVEVFQAGSAANRPASPTVALPVSSTELVSGGPDSLLQLSGQGLLGDQAAVIAGDKLAARPALWAVTDGQRRQDTAFGLINANTSFTYTATETNPADDPLGGSGGPPRQILPVPAAGHQTVAVLSGAASVTASSYGSWLTYQPQYDPVNAFDGSSATAWAEGSPETPVGQWIQITFSKTLTLPSSIGVQLLNDGFSRSIANQLKVSTAQGSVVTATTPTNATQQLGVRPGPTRWLRITITGASNVVAGNPGAGIRDVLIPGVRVTRYLEPAEGAVAGVSASAIAFSFHQPAPAPAGVADREATSPFARLFTLPVPLRLGVSASAVAQPSAGLDTLLGKLARPSKSALLVSASSTWGNLPEFGPDNLFNPKTSVPWIAGSSDPVISVSWHRARRISQIVVQPAYGFAAAPTKIKVTSPSGTREATIGLGGVASFTPALTTSQLQVSFPGWAADAQPGASSGQPVLGLSKLTIPALSGLSVDTLDTSAPFSLACGSGPVISIDGRGLPTAVSGTLGELAGGLPVTVRLCSQDSSVTLGSGKQRLYVAPGLFTMTDVALRSAAAVSPSTTPARSLRVLSWQPDNRSVRIGPGQEAYVEVHQNANPGWEAALNGHRLASATLDGWQQGFIVPAGAGGVITLTFAPATWYHIGLALAVLALIGLACVAAGWRRWMSYVIPAVYFAVLESGTILLLSGTRLAAVWEPLEALGLLAVAVIGLAYVRFRRQPGRVPPGAPGSRDASIPAAQAEDTGQRPWAATARPVRSPRPLLRWAGPAAVAVLILFVGGPVVLVLPVVALVAALRPRFLPLVSLLAMLAAGLIAATATAPATLGGGAFGPAGQACALLALAAALYPASARAWAADRSGWRPSRPLPGRGTRSKLPPGDRHQPLGIGGGPR
jgi:arabinofuranan 3-O-arabinosyltransferase